MAIDETRAQSFCCWYVKLGNAEEAAVRAGYPRENALEEGLRILRREKYRRLTEQMRGMFSCHIREQVMSGLERLAFGEISDAVQLVLLEECPSVVQLRQMNLFNVSEIKRVKGGGVEVKLFDRQKALEKMMEYAGNADQRSAAKSLLSALAGAGEDEL